MLHDVREDEGEVLQRGMGHAHSSDRHPCPHLTLFSPSSSLCLYRALDKLKKQIQAAKEEKKRLRELRAAGIDPASVKKQEVTGTALYSTLPSSGLLAPSRPNIYSHLALPFLHATTR